MRWTFQFGARTIDYPDNRIQKAEMKFTETILKDCECKTITEERENTWLQILEAEHEEKEKEK